MAKECLWLVITDTRGSLLIIKKVEMVSKSGTMGSLIRDNGRITICMGTESGPSPMEARRRVCGPMETE